MIGDVAAFVVTTKATAIPDDVLEHASTLLADAVACGLLGSSTSRALATRQALETTGATGTHRAWGTDQLWSLLDAVLLDAIAVDALDADDATRDALVHIEPVTVVPALHLLVTQEPVADSLELLASIVIGSEVALRVGRAAGFAMLEQGFHPAPMSGTFAAAATAARLLRLGEDAAAHALAIAGSLGAGLMGAQRGAGVKAVHMGRAAQAGVFAAIAAERGLTGALDVLDENSYGSFVTTLSPTRSVAREVQDFGDVWRTREIEVKLYPSGASTYSAIDAIDEISTKGALPEPDGIERIDVGVQSVTLAHAGWSIDTSEGAGSARLNIPWCIATRILRGAVTLDSFSEEALADAAVKALAERVNVYADPALDALGIQGRHAVKLQLISGASTTSVELDRGRGSESSPVSPDRFMAKVDDFCMRSRTSWTGSSLLSAVEGLRSADLVRETVTRFWSDGEQAE